MLETGLLFSLIFVLGMVVVSAFFSWAETGLTAANRAHLRQLAQEGNRRAALVLRLRDDQDNLIGAILLGNNMANIGSSALATGVAIGLFGEEGVAVATVMMTVLILIFAEVLPKTYAINHAERVALLAAPAFNIIVKVLAPITRTVQRIVSFTLRLFGAPLENGATLVSAVDIIRGTINLHSEEGDIKKQDRDMLGGVLDLGNRTVGDIMVHRRHMMTVDAGQAPLAIVEEVLSAVHTRLPVWRDNPDNIIGVLHVKDVIKAIQASDGDPRNFDVLSIAKEPWFVPDTTTLKDQLQAFRRRRTHMALVVDEYGTLQGMLTVEDIIEEIIGRMPQEHDQPSHKIHRESGGSYRLDGAIPVRDLNRELDWKLPEEFAATVAGLVIHEVERIPDIGETFLLHNCAFEITGREGNQVTSLRIKQLEPQKDEDIAGE